METWEPEALDAVETEVSAKAAPSFETVFDYADIQVEAILADARRQAEEIKTSARISVGQELDVRILCYVGQEVVLLVFELNALHGYSDHLAFRCLDGLSHEGVVVEFACAEKKAR